MGQGQKISVDGHGWERSHPDRTVCCCAYAANRMDDTAPEDDGPLLSRREIAAACVFAAVVTVASFMLLPWAAAVATGLLAVIMALITLADLRHFIIPDLLSLPAIPLGAIANVVVFHGGDWPGGLTESLVGAVLGAGTFYLLRSLYARLRKREGLGLGDVKLAGVAGAWLGPVPLASVCLVAALAGLAAVLVMALLPGRRLAATDFIPFGSFIAPSILLFWLWRVLADAPY